MAGYVALIGLLAGWLLCQVSERMPYKTGANTLSASALAPAVGKWAMRLLCGRPIWRGRMWLMLHMGVVFGSAAVFSYVWKRFGVSWEAAQLIGIYMFLILIALIDLKYRRVPNILVYPALGIALLFKGLASPESMMWIGVGGGMAFFIFYLTAWLRPGDLGGGDIKLATLIGIGFGFPQVLWALLVGAGAGGVTAVFLLLTARGGMKSHMPYAPFLCLGALVALVYNPFLYMELS
ncbi:MAG: A24 family peptidase [Chloroflexota bacterium]